MWFPETSRTLAVMGAEVILHPTLTGTIDRDIELSIAQATAATNQCFFFDVNGLDTGGSGRSIVCGPDGRVIYQAQHNEEFFPIEIDMERVRRSRELGVLRLGQPLKSFRDHASDFSHLPARRAPPVPRQPRAADQAEPREGARRAADPRGSARTCTSPQADARAAARLRRGHGRRLGLIHHCLFPLPQGVSAHEHCRHWFEIPVYDITRAAAFYNAIFGFEMELSQNGEHTMAFFPRTGIGGALVAGPGCTPSDAGVLVYLNANGDLDGVLGRVEYAGGRVVMPRSFISEESGSFALFIDSEGNRLALHEGPAPAAATSAATSAAQTPAAARGRAGHVRGCRVAAGEGEAQAKRRQAALTGTRSASTAPPGTRTHPPGACSPTSIPSRHVHHRPVHTSPTLQRRAAARYTWNQLRLQATALDEARWRRGDGGGAARRTC